MKNINFEIKGDQLLIAVDLSKTFRLSASGKNIIIASTEGNVPIVYNRENVSVGVNVYKK